MSGQRIERLAVVGQVRDQRRHAFEVERLQVDVEERIILRHEVRHDMTAGLAGTAGEHNSFGRHDLSRRVSPDEDSSYDNMAAR